MRNEITSCWEVQHFGRCLKCELIQATIAYLQWHDNDIRVTRRGLDMLGLYEHALQVGLWSEKPDRPGLNYLPQQTSCTVCHICSPIQSGQCEGLCLRCNLVQAIIIYRKQQSGDLFGWNIDDDLANLGLSDHVQKIGLLFLEQKMMLTPTNEMEVSYA